MIWSLQLLRFAAALMVLFFHLEWSASGYKGVDLFFVLSGFVMFHVLRGRTAPPMRVFTWRRLTRIFPLYWLALLTLFGVEPFPVSGELLDTVLLVPGHHAQLNVSWSLSYELYFYLLVAVIAYAVPYRIQNLVYLVLMLTTTIFTVFNAVSGQFEGTILNFMLGGNTWEFLLGVLSGHLFLHSMEMRWKPVHDMVLIIVAILFVMVSFRFDHPCSQLVYGPLSFIIIMGLALREKNRGFPSPFKTTAGIAGDASYALYLFGPILTTLWEGNQSILVLLAILFSSLVGRFVEKPILHTLRSIVQK